MKKVAGFGLPFVLTHFICCGALLFWLIGSGYLLVMSNEGRDKVFLIPALLFIGILIYLYKYQSKCCREKGEKTLKDFIFQFLLYSLIVLIFSLAFIVYVYIPWWIPDYKGGNLLP